MSGITTVDYPTMPTVAGKWEGFKPTQYIPSNFFSASSSIPGVSESQMNQDLQKIQEQRNACKVASANMGLIKDIFAVEGAAMGASFQAAKNSITRSSYQMDLRFQSDKANIKQSTNKKLLDVEQKRADLKVQSAQDKLAHEERKAAIPKEFYSKIESLERKKWEFRVSDMEHAIRSARQLSDSASASLQTLEAELVA